MTKKHVKAGRKGGIMGTGKSKRRGSADYYRELGRKSGEARRKSKAIKTEALVNGTFARLADAVIEIGKKAEARRRKLESVCWASHEPEISTGAWINGPSGDVIVDGAGEHYDNCFNSHSPIDTTVNKE